MKLHLELFVRDMEASIGFYTRALGFEVLRRDSDYASLRRDRVILGIGSASKLPRKSGYFTRDILNHRRGLGVEIVLEVNDIETRYRHVHDSGYPVTERLQERPWGPTDFRIVNPDGYYLRLTSRT